MEMLKRIHPSYCWIGDNVPDQSTSGSSSPIEDSSYSSKYLYEAVNQELIKHLLRTSAANDVRDALTTLESLRATSQLAIMTNIISDVISKIQAMDDVFEQREYCTRMLPQITIYF